MCDIEWMAKERLQLSVLFLSINKGAQTQVAGDSSHSYIMVKRKTNSVSKTSRTELRIFNIVYYMSVAAIKGNPAF